MFKVNGLNFNCNKMQFKPAFTSNTIAPQQPQSISDVTADYNVKVPSKYSKTGEITLPYDYKAHCYKLSNGQRVIIVPKEGKTVVKTYVGTGSMNEPDNVRGISHYIEHNLFNGSEGLEAGEFFKTTNEMGAQTNASTGFAQTDYYISSNLLNKDDLEKEIKIHASMLESPKFAVEMLEKEKGIVNSEINMYQGYVDTIAINSTLKKLYNIQSTSNDLIAGSTKNITNLTREDVVDYYNNNYYPANMVTVVTGKVNPDDTIKLISKYFSGKNKITHPRKFEELKPIQNTVRQDLTSDKTQSAYIIVGFNGYKNNDLKNEICMDIARDILTTAKTGRMASALKPYNAGASLIFERVSSREQDPVAVFVETSVNDGNCEQVLQEIFNQVHSVTVNQDFDLDAIKKSKLNELARVFERSMSMNTALGQSVLNGKFNDLAKYEQILNSITKDDVSNAVKEYMNLNKAVVTVVHPQKKQDVTFTGSKQAVNPDNVKHYVMANNFDVVMNNSKTDLSTISVIYKTDDYLDKNPAFALLLSSILNEGSAFKNDIELNKELDREAVELYASASETGMSFKAYCSSDNISKALDTGFEILQHPRFNQETFEYSKQKLLDILERADKSASDKLNKELFDNLPIGCTKEEVIEGIKNAKLDDVKDLYKKLQENSKAYITVSAPFDKKQNLQRTIFSKAAVLPKVKPADVVLRDTFKPVENVKVLTDTHTKNQAEIIEAFKFKTNMNIKDVAAIGLMNKILGGSSSSRLFTDLREKQQLAYHVNSSVEYIDNAGVLSMSIETTTDNKDSAEISYDNVKKSIEGFNKHVNLMKTTKVTEEELKNAKLQYINSILSNSETSSDKNRALASSIHSQYGLMYENKLIKAVEEVTADDIYNAANYIFTNKPVYSILATQDTLDANKTYFSTLAN